MVFTTQCPNPKCRKFMLVEDRDLNKVVQCLICKSPIRVTAAPIKSSKPTPLPK